MIRATGLVAILAVFGCGGDDGGGGGGGPDAGNGPDTTAPTILSITPADGASGVASDASVVIEFSEAMDPLSVQNSIAAADLGAVTYAWSEGDSVLTITPTNGLAYAEGDDPEVLAALEYTVIIGTGGQDLAGNTVGAGQEATFSTYRAITAELPAIDALTATGEPGAILTTSGDLYVGDDGNGGAAKGARAYVSMDLSDLPTEAEGIESATLSTLSTGSNGSPFVELGTLILDHTSYAVASLDFETATAGEVNAAFNQTALSSVGVWMSNDAATPSIDVTAQVRDDVAQRVARGDRSQYRARMATDLNLDGNQDGVLLSRAQLSLEVVYLLP